MQERTYNGDTVIVNVGGLVELLLELGVTLARPRGEVWLATTRWAKDESRRADVLDTTRVQGSAIHRCGNHVSE